MKEVSEKKKYLVTAVTGLVIAVIVMLVKRVFSADSARAVFRILADSFTIPGGLMLAAGLIYMTRVLFRTKTQTKEGSISENEEGRVEPYVEFIIKRHNEQQVTGYSFILLSAAAFLILAGICILLYYHV